MIYFLFILIILSFYRGVLKFVFTESIKSAGKNRTIIFGAGKIGAMIKRSFSSSSSFNIIGFIDDDKSKHGKYIDGIKIFSLEDIIKIPFDNVIISTKKLK